MMTKENIHDAVLQLKIANYSAIVEKIMNKERIALDSYLNSSDECFRSLIAQYGQSYHRDKLLFDYRESTPSVLVSIIIYGNNNQREFIIRNSDNIEMIELAETYLNT